MESPTPWWPDVLRRARRTRDLSQRQLADRACLPVSTVGDLETGRVAPRVPTLDRALLAMGYRLDVLDAADRPLTWTVTVSGDEPRDAAGRRYPPHLDVRRRYPRREGLPPSLLYPGTVWTFHLDRVWRDAMRLTGRFGLWGCGPPSPGGLDAHYIREVWGDDVTDAFLDVHSWLVHALNE